MKSFNRIIYLLISLIFVQVIVENRLNAQDFQNQRFDRQRVIRPSGSVPCYGSDTSELKIIYSVLFDFNLDTLILSGIDTMPPDYNENRQSSQISDVKGILAARFTGQYISDRYGRQTDLTPYFNYELWRNSYSRDNSLILPYPDKPNYFILVFLSNLIYDDTIGVPAPEALSAAYFHSNFDGSLTIDSVKTNILLGKYLFDGGLSACRHANGRDWWVMAPIRRSHFINIFLLTPDGLKFNKQIETELPLIKVLNSPNFSPKGNYFVLGTEESLIPPMMHKKKSHVQIFKFDRCEGSLFYAIDFYLPQEDSNCCLSPIIDINERFIYVPTCNAIWQGDLWADDIPTSFIKVCEADYTIKDNAFFHVIGGGFHGADGKMYFLDNNNNYGMTVINYPERGGLACDARYAGIIKPGCTGASTGNMPYYGLGPLDGSPCDTLGLDGPLSKKPEQAHNPPLIVSPNPGTGTFFVQLPSQGGLLSVYDLNGILVHSERISDFQMVAEINLAAGVYIVQYLSRDGSIRSGAKVVSR